MIGNTLVSTFKQHKTAVLMVLAGGQLAVLLTMPSTLFTLTDTRSTRSSPRLC
jgi:hypothetical protein